MPPPLSYDELSEQIIGAAIEVHRELGPGLLESIYEHCLELELRKLGLTVLRQHKVNVEYKGAQLDLGFRIDLWVDGRVIVEIKAVEAKHPVHAAQLLTYLKLTDCRLGLLINFNQQTLVKGVNRVANGLIEGD
ncbi:MAG: GxxExxY protein [Flavobacteriales bacterium]|nr:GxxExxY protein [Flavobacteriales bacterium]